MKRRIRMRPSLGLIFLPVIFILFSCSTSEPVKKKEDVFGSWFTCYKNGLCYSHRVVEPYVPVHRSASVRSYANYYKDLQKKGWVDYGNERSCKTSLPSLTFVQPMKEFIKDFPGHDLRIGLFWTIFLEKSYTFTAYAVDDVKGYYRERMTFIRDKNYFRYKRTICVNENETTFSYIPYPVDGNKQEVREWQSLK